MLLYVSKVPIVVCLTSAGPKILTEVETLGERCPDEEALTFVGQTVSAAIQAMSQVKCIFSEQSDY